MKCQHGQIITKFCISENCVNKIACGCIYCLKRNHFHLGKVETLNVDEVEQLIKSLNIKQDKRNKQSSIKQLLINYFQGLKAQINKSLQTICHSMMDRIQNSYLFNLGVLQTYKKIENKQYKKISAQQLRHLYLMNQKNHSTNLLNQQHKYYHQEIIKIQSTIQSIKKVFESYQLQINSYDKHFSPDSFFYKRIIQIIQKIKINTKINYQQDIKLSSKNNHINNKNINNVSLNNANINNISLNNANINNISLNNANINNISLNNGIKKLKQPKPQLNILNHQLNLNKIQSNHQNKHQRKQSYDQHQIETKYQAKYEANHLQKQKHDNIMPFKIRVTQKIKNNPQNDLLNRSFQQPQPPKLLSLAQYRNQKTKSSQSIHSKNNIKFELLNVKTARQRRPSFNMDHLSPLDKNNSENQYSNKSILSIQIKSPIEKLQDLYKKDVKKLNLKNHSYKIQQDDTHKQFAIQIKNPQNSQVSNRYTRQNNLQLLNGHFHWKQCNSQIFELQNQQQNNKKQQNKNKTKIPYFINQSGKSCQHEQVKKKIIKFDMENIGKDHLNQSQSPIFRKKFHINPIDQSVQLKKMCSAQNKDQKPLLMRKLSAHASAQQLFLHEDQVKSTVLLLQSLKLQPELAIQYLRKSFQYCPSNLSTAQYLSYLLLEQNHPKECLQLCNYVLTQIKNAQNYNFSAHILNNKAAALNLLGRFSECIQFAQKIIQHVQKDTLYKNLGDAYCSLGITQKSILNYQKCISINQQFDEAYYNLAVCFYTQHHYSQALQMVSEAIRLNSEKDQYIELYRNTKSKIS